MYYERQVLKRPLWWDIITEMLLTYYWHGLHLKGNLKVQNTSFLVKMSTKWFTGSLYIKAFWSDKRGAESLGQKTQKVGLNLKLIGYLLLNRSWKFIYHPLWKTSYYALNSKLVLFQCFNMRDWIPALYISFQQNMPSPEHAYFWAFL